MKKIILFTSFAFSVCFYTENVEVTRYSLEQVGIVEYYGVIDPGSI
ncbi:hypothetical protein [Bacillus cereus]|uniref:Uncharacterized protein n=1 Tax=Bacillus cereus TaxID=1396 RepID=A0AAW5KTA4_BACCE|nr:hypothetical protein [Bacillus cereus]MCQ6284878.1 hypothetical protein [Bacillus cereus]MCQ6305922.1 hypothetical protein [Bacillus cereus]MCQ6313960.1 hypothetical protein [Bacillus cereus]MCQ6330333.1 hypothetical protein [Bacillus cereus]MCQ6381860.1 hypothetical protein [Bacillus cereus]